MRNNRTAALNNGLIDNISPVFYFDLSDYNRLGGTLTEIQDRSPAYFSNPRASGNDARAAVPAYTNSTSIQTGWTSGDTGTYKFLADATVDESRAFYTSAGTSVWDDYSDVSLVLSVF